MSALTKSFGVNGLSADILSGSGRVPPPWGVSAPECKSRCQVSSFKQPSNREPSLITTCILWLVAIQSKGTGNNSRAESRRSGVGLPTTTVVIQLRPGGVELRPCLSLGRMPRSTDGEEETMSETNGERSTREPASTRAITRNRYDAVLLDLDGVITDTASIHAACWKQMFDEYLQKRATQRGAAFRPFDIATDYRLYVDGKPRYDGVRDFLTSRGIELPQGSPDDPPQAETVDGLGNRKNDLVNKIIEDKG